MCFSAGASFTASVVIGAAGVVSLSMVKERQHKLFAAIPLLFAAQQFAEGLVWLSYDLPGERGLHDTAMYVFLFFAQVLWPVWVPVSILMLERGRKQRAVLKIILAIGIGVALYMVFALLFLDITGEAVGGHIRYTFGIPGILLWVSIVLYGIATVVAPLASAIRGMRTLSISLMVSYIITTVFYHYYITSVWCYFASLISLIVVYIIYHVERGKRRAAKLGR